MASASPWICSWSMPPAEKPSCLLPRTQAAWCCPCCRCMRSAGGSVIWSVSARTKRERQRLQGRFGGLL